MTKPRSIFISYSGDEANVVQRAAEIIGHSLIRDELDVGPVHRCRAFDVEFSLFGKHGLDDDSGIEFSKYEYQLYMTAFEVGPQISLFKTMYESLALFLAERLCADLRCGTLVVENLQREVAAFRP